MQTAPQAPEPIQLHRETRRWRKTYTPEEVNAVFRDYDDGMNAGQIKAKHGISKSALYKWIKAFRGTAAVESNPAALRKRIATLEHTVLVLAERLAAFEKPQEGDP